MRTNRYRRGPRLAAAGLAIAAAAALLQLAAAAPAPAATTPFLTVGLGDSVPSGSACHCTSYVVQLGNTLARRAGRPASVANLATGGQTSGGLLVQLQRAPVRSLIARADVVVIEVGANDFDESIVATSLCRDIASSHCYQHQLLAQRSRLLAALQQIGALRAGHPGRVMIAGYWNIFKDGRVGRARGAAYVAHSNALTVRDNTIIAGVAALRHVSYVDLYRPFKGGGSRDDTALLASDGDHPNAAGHALIAQAFAAA